MLFIAEIQGEDQMSENCIRMAQTVLKLSIDKKKSFILFLVEIKTVSLSLIK